MIPVRVSMELRNDCVLKAAQSKINHLWFKLPNLKVLTDRLFCDILCCKRSTPRKFQTGCEPICELSVPVVPQQGVPQPAT
jgi:hypothetical protein